jgi:branched-chain amino acid transport system substrate-binding protein
MRTFKIVSLFVLAALILSACGGGATPVPPTQAPAAPAATKPPEATKPPAPTQPPAPAKFECKDAVGCVDVAPGKPIRIAYMMVVAGPDASLGTDTKRGVELAIVDKKTVLDHPIELIGEDTGCGAEGGQTAATKLAPDKSIVGIVGTSCSSEARAALPIICKAGIQMISASNTAPDLTDAKRPAEYWCYARTAHNDLVQGKAAATFAFQKMGVKKAATIHDGSIYADKLQQVFSDEFKKLGGTITAQEAVAPTDTDMKPVLTRIAAGKPEFIYYPIFIAAGGQITKQAREIADLAKVYLMSADGTFSPDFVKAAGPGAKDMFHSSPDFSAFGAGYADFLKKHEAKYGEKTLAPFHAHAYDAANMFFAAIEKVAVKDADGTLHIGRKALSDAVFATKDFKGLTGNLTCTPTGDCADPKIAVYQMMSTDPAKWNPGAAADSNPKKIWP